jgi:hypothetical protein
MPGPETRMILRVFFLSQASLCTAQELSLSIAAKNSVTDIYIGVLAAPQAAVAIAIAFAPLSSLFRCPDFKPRPHIVSH